MFFLYIFFFNVLEFCVLKCKRSSKAVENKSHKILQKAADRWKALTEAKEKSKKKKQKQKQTAKTTNIKSCQLFSLATAASEEAAASAATPDCSQRRAGNNKLR